MSDSENKQGGILTADDIEAIASRVHEKLKSDPPLLLKMLGDVTQLAEVLGRWSTAEQIIKLKCLAGAHAADSHQELFQYAVKALQPEGMLLEFGVATGETINMLSQLTPNRKWYGFDSFQGLPEDWFWLARKGGFTQGGVVPKVNANVEIVPGMFEDVLPRFIVRYTEELKRDGIAMIHIDCDLYSSTKTILNMLAPYCRVGSVLQFDEYWYFADWQNGEAKAFDEFIVATGFRYKPLAYRTIGGQFSVLLT